MENPPVGPQTLAWFFTAAVAGIAVSLLLGDGPLVAMGFGVALGLGATAAVLTFRRWTGRPPS